MLNLSFIIDHPEMKIKQIRELKNVSQEFVADQLELSIRAYSKIETGETQLINNGCFPRKTNPTIRKKIAVLEG